MVFRPSKVNYLVAVSVIKATLPMLKKTVGSEIINISSRDHEVIYCSSKELQFSLQKVSVVPLMKCMVAGHGSGAVFGAYSGN